jgi:hypothetical protein
MSAEAAEAPAEKRQKMEDYPMAPDSDWPEAWMIPDDIPFGEEQVKPNRLEPNVPVSAEDLKKLGICYWKMDDVEKYEYPVKSVPWDPKDATDPKLKALRDSRGYSYADIITVHPDHLPEFDKKIQAFFEEVRHSVGFTRCHVAIPGDLCRLSSSIFALVLTIGFPKSLSFSTFMMRKRYVTSSEVVATLTCAMLTTNGFACM